MTCSMVGSISRLFQHLDGLGYWEASTMPTRNMQQWLALGVRGAWRDQASVGMRHQREGGSGGGDRRLVRCLETETSVTVSQR